MAYDYAYGSGPALAGALIAEAARLKMMRNGQPMLSLQQADELGRQVAGNLGYMRNTDSPLGRMALPGGSIEAGLTSFLPGLTGDHPALESAAQSMGIPDGGLIRTAPNLWLTFDDFRVGAPEKGIAEVRAMIPSGATVEQQLDAFLSGIGADLRSIDVGPLTEPSAGKIGRALQPDAVDSPDNGLGR